MFLCVCETQECATWENNPAAHNAAAWLHTRGHGKRLLNQTRMPEACPHSFRASRTPPKSHLVETELPGWVGTRSRKEPQNERKIVKRMVRVALGWGHPYSITFSQS